MDIKLMAKKRFNSKKSQIIMNIIKDKDVDIQQIFIDRLHRK